MTQGQRTTDNGPRMDLSEVQSPGSVVTAGNEPVNSFVLSGWLRIIPALHR